MYQFRLAQYGRVTRFIALAILLLAALPALAQANLRATEISSTSIKLTWDAVAGVTHFGVLKFGHNIAYVQGTSYTVTGLSPNTTYSFQIAWPGGSDSVSAQTEAASDSGAESDSAVERTKFSERAAGDREDSAEEAENNAFTPPPVTCPNLPPRVLVSGYARETHCQMVGEVVIGKTDLVQRGFIDAVDVWHYVNGGLEVCFRNNGWLAFLDATYLQRKVMELEHYHRDGMTCGMIDRIGTVVLLERPAPPAEGALPLFHSIPLSDCQIKLVETLFLRAEPAGEIIGLVWLNSEVPAFEINGYWYKIEFEGKAGYISRYHRKVLRGGCG